MVGLARQMDYTGEYQMAQPMTIPGRCESSHRVGGAISLVATFGGTAPVIRCRQPEGHDGPHKGSFQPFPGFADEYREWTDPAVTA